ncbi:hypothetical protein FEZ60_02545 [Rhodococcus sp. MS16]|uniref:Acg family FMN-binding oxidoreductase n=1 Tax=Rhodococcus sp. MS16 TaxID=2579941 RepID=UPI00156259C6|nr:hypothetical protein [Rhodococcus sp. MS16]NRI64428.1 hypothetical protein [Rhodococcus sp. MS16]
MDITRPDSSVLQLAVELACRAPSLHNSQPWRWEHSGGELKLFGDRTRLLPAADPTGRQLHISCGAALHHLSVGLLGLRWTTDIRYERRAMSPDLLATIGFRRDARPRSHDFDMLTAIRRRRTDRRAFGIFDEINSLVESAVDQAQELNVSVIALDEAQREGLVEATRSTAAARRYDVEYQTELHWWAGHSMTSGGIPETSLVAGSGGVPIGRTFPTRQNAPTDPTGFADESTVLALGTPSDSRMDWLRCGHALSSILLEATVRGAATCPLSHVTEVPRSRSIIQRMVPEIGTPQMLVRIGRAPTGTRPQPTPRRPVTDVFSSY